jgi:ribosomal protein S18 acetylase RimI-like enzyme
MILHHRRHSIRIYSLGVLPIFRGNGAGRRLVKMAIALSRTLGMRAVVLEADRRNKTLVSWYEGFGFRSSAILKNYYSPGRHAVRMRMELMSALKKGGVRVGS